MTDKDRAELADNLELIRAALLSLKPAGASGFEGLLRLALTNLTGIPFRLAASGLQGGMDGASAMQNDEVCFEAKRYSHSPKRETVLTKITDLARNETAADRLWVLGVTADVNTQLAEAVHADGDRYAISTLILDWISNPLPLLAIAVVASGDQAIDFLIKNFEGNTGQNANTKAELEAAFSVIIAHAAYSSTLERLKSDLNGSKLAFARAVKMNTEWRTEAFKSTSQSRIHFGQPLAVQEVLCAPKLREDLRRDLHAYIYSGQDLVLAGDEGHGKSWLAAQLCAESEGMALFVSAEQFDGLAPDDIQNFLVDLLIKQSGDYANEALKHRWRYRLKAWKATPPLAQFFVVVDGINQRQGLRWARLLNSLQNYLHEIGGRLIITVRPQFWKKAVARGLAFKPKLVNVPEWLPTERDTLLQHQGIDLYWLDESTLRTLRNPRLLTVAMNTMPDREAAAWKGLTTDRLLMEHLRASQLENFEDNEKFVTLAARLSEHAQKVLKSAQVSGNPLPQDFQAQSNDVIETRFFRPVEGPGDLYELRDEGLTLALGFALVDQLWQTHRAKGDVAERVVRLIEPINAMDRAVDVLFAALLVCATDEDVRFDTTILSSLLDAFANLQNVNDQRFENFVEIVKQQPIVFFDVSKSLCLEPGRRINNDWFYHAAFEVAATENGWKAAESAIHHWLQHYNIDPVSQANRYPRRDEVEFEKHLQKTKQEIDKALSELSAFERQLLGKMTEVHEELDDLFNLALQLLAGRPLASFANSFITMGLAFSLCSGLYQAQKTFTQLTIFNRFERAAMKTAFLAVIKPLRGEDTSKGGQWTIARMLLATGDEAAANEAKSHMKELRKDWPEFKLPQPDEWREIKVADPSAQKPSDMAAGEEQFNALEVGSLRHEMSAGMEDHRFDEFLPVACRFAPAVAIDKTRSFLSELLSRSGFPLRQVILNSETYLPLITPDLVKHWVKRISESNIIIESLPEQDRRICRSFAFYLAVAQLSAEEQLDCMMRGSFGEHYLLSVIPYLKPQTNENIVNALHEVLAKDDDHAAFRVLSLASYGNTPITADLDALILKCSAHDSSSLRAASFKLAVQNDLKSVRQAHVKTKWSAYSVKKNTYEEWFGSALLIQACACGEMSIEDLLMRISQRTWFVAAHHLGEDFAQPMAEAFLKKLRKGIDATAAIAPPLIDLTLTSSDTVPFAMLSIDGTGRGGERFPKQKSLRAILEDDDFDEKQKSLHAISDALFNELENTGAKLLVERITIKDMQYLVDIVPSLLASLVEIVGQARSAQFIWLKNLAFVIGKLISAQFPEKAVALFERALASEGFVTLALGDDLVLEHAAIWGSERSPPIEALWRKRILSAETDEVLAREILAAERFGQSDFVRALVMELYSNGDSLNIAYALSIIGYSIKCEDLIEIVEKFKNSESFVGESAKHAIICCHDVKYAKHWVDKMWDASTVEEFWCCLMIAQTCMDARVSRAPNPNSNWVHYAGIFQKVRKAAISKKAKDRKKKLVGQEAPDKIFVTL